jgi:hypothetical protein
MDSRNLTIGVLSVTAAILLVGLVVVHALPQPAQGSGVSAWAREYNYFMAAGRMQQTEEQLFVIDAARSRMNAYSVDIQAREIRMDDTISLDQMRAATGGDEGRAATPRNRRR